MPERQLLVIPLPTGRTGVIGRLSVFLSPRLVEAGASGILRDYADWRAWPDVVTDPAFALTVLLDGNAVPATVVSPPADPAVWAAVFGAPTTTQVAVEPYRFVDRTQVSFPAAYDPARLEADAMAAYHHVAVTWPEQIPTAADLAGLPPLDALLGDNLDNALSFMKPLEPATTPDLSGPSLEFHATVTHLGAHPELLRLLGLVIDLEIPLPAQPPTGVSVRTGYQGMFPGATGPARQVRFRTAVGPDFRPSSNPDPKLGDQIRGHLPIGARGYHLNSTDTLIAAQRLDTYRSQADGDGALRPLPPLREQGISVVRTDMRALLEQVFVRQLEMQDAIVDQLAAGPQSPPVELYAEDVTMGQRYDARVTGTPVWRSLFARHVPDGYVFAADTSQPPLQIVPAPDEGWQGVTLLTEADRLMEPYQQPEGDLRLLDRTPQRVHDAVFRWNGWSAAARMPGRMLAGDKGRTIDQEANAPRADDPVQFRADYRVLPGSLPTLRYGRSYDLRARCVDVAGNSLAVTDPAPPGTVGTEVFARLQPIAPPTVVRRSPRPDPGEGDTTTTIVIRSEWDDDDADVRPSDRLLFPPRVSPQRVELHDLPGGGVRPDAYAFLADRDARDLAAQTVVDPRSGELVAGQPANGEPAKDAVRPGPPRPVVRYLSDPATSSVGMAGLPGTPDTVVVPYGGDWPTPRAIRVELRAGTAAPELPGADAPTSVRVFLPKAHVVDAEIASAVAEPFLEHFKLWHELDPLERAQLRPMLVSGRHWMISPRSTVTLVHAVRQPLVAPSLHGLSAERPAIGSLTATFDAAVSIDRLSTQLVDLVARWTDPVDVGPAPGEVTQGRMLARLRIASEGDPTVENLDGIAFEIGDTKRHRVQVETEAFSRFSRYFTERVDTSFASGDTIQLHPAGVVVDRTEVHGSDGTVYQGGTDYTVSTAGTVTRIPDGRIGQDEPLSVRYVPLPVSRHSSEHGVPADVLVPSSALPLPVEVDSVLPAFHRTVEDRGDEILVTHDAQALRVQVCRPWWSSGEGETLGVVLDSGASTQPVPATTRWGRDPLTDGTGPGTAPVLADFSGTADSAVAIDGLHDVAAYDVRYDADRQAWLADVRIVRDLGYRPFVQLALARFQPESVPGAHLSPLARPDPVRLGASRLVLVRRGSQAVSVTVTGHDDDNVMRVTVQRPEPAVTDPDLRWTAASPPLELARLPRATDTQWTGDVPLPAGEHELRLLIEDLEPGVADDGAATKVHTVAYVETVGIPATWFAG